MRCVGFLRADTFAVPIRNRGGKESQTEYSDRSLIVGQDRSVPNTNPGTYIFCGCAITNQVERIITGTHCARQKERAREDLSEREDPGSPCSCESRSTKMALLVRVSIDKDGFVGWRHKRATPLSCHFCSFALSLLASYGMLRHARKSSFSFIAAGSAYVRTESSTEAKELPHPHHMSPSESSQWPQSRACVGQCWKTLRRSSGTFLLEYTLDMTIFRNALQPGSPTQRASSLSSRRRMVKLSGLTQSPSTMKAGSFLGSQTACLPPLVRCILCVGRERRRRQLEGDPAADSSGTTHGNITRVCCL